MDEEGGYQRSLKVLNTDQAKIGYLGPKGTFTQEAAYLVFGDGEKVEFVPFRTILESGQAVLRRQVTMAVVPCENSTEGAVNIVTDFLLTTPTVKICAEVVLPVRHSLIGVRKVPLTAVKTVVSHPQALAQCRRWLSRNLGSYAEVEAPSTAYAVENTSQFGNPKTTAAIGTSRAAQLYKRVVLQEGIEDSTTNTTRFWVIGQRDCSMTGDDKTVVIFLGVSDISIFLRLLGSLTKVLKINIQRVETRPTKRTLGTYHFLVEMHGHWSEERFKRLLQIIKERLPLVKIRVAGSFRSVFPANGSVKAATS